MKNLSEYVKTAEAAQILGVAQNTLRKWAEQGDIPVHRNPANGYLASVGIDSEEAIRRLRKIEHLGFRRQGELISFEWQYPTMLDWAAALGIVDAPVAEGVSQ
ncbi:MAG: helix-turn-helix domain-containing protein [Pirellula sp.]|nr:helix-turn-helix domain-containing protein [Pirellula sp.]